MHQSKWEFYWLRNTYEGASVQVTLWGWVPMGGAGSRLSSLDVQHPPLGVTRPHTALAWSWAGVRGGPRASCTSLEEEDSLAPAFPRFIRQQCDPTAFRPDSGSHCSAHLPLPAAHCQPRQARSGSLPTPNVLWCCDSENMEAMPWKTRPDKHGLNKVPNRELNSQQLLRGPITHSTHCFTYTGGVWQTTCEL